MVCHKLAKIGSHCYCSSSDIMFLACYVIKTDRVNKESYNYNYNNPSR